MTNSLKKFFGAILIAVLAVGMLTGCGAKEIGAAESTKVMFDLFIANDSSSAQSVGITQEEADELIKATKEATIATLKGAFTVNGLDISDEKVNEIYEAQLAQLKKTTIEVEEVGTEGDNKKFKISTTFVPTATISENAGKKFEEKIGEITDINQAGEALANIIIEELNNATISEEKASFEAEYALGKYDVNGKGTKIWMPVDEAGFGQQLASAVTGMLSN